MKADVFIVHRDDDVLHAIVRLLVQERFRVRTAESLEALGRELAAAVHPAVLLVDDDAVGADWRERLAGIRADVPRVILTWYPHASVPPNVTPLGKPFGARELLDTVLEKVGAGGPPLRRPR